MSLIELTLEGIKNKVNIAIERLKHFEPPEGYYLAFSGGKDSQCIYELAKMSGVRFDAHFHFTTVDPPELLKFIRDNYLEVKFHRPKKSMFQLIPKKLMPPTRMVRYCCEYLKEYGGKGRLVVTGIKWKESYKRSKRKIFEIDTKTKTKKFLNPIIDWTEQDSWEFIKQRNLKYCSLYDEGFKRIGCILCPMQTIKGKLKEKERYPKFYKAYLLAFKKMLIERNKRTDLRTEWDTPEDVMDWWIYGGKSKKKQDMLFN